MKGLASKALGSSPCRFSIDAIVQSSRKTICLTLSLEFEFNEETFSWISVSALSVDLLLDNLLAQVFHVASYIIS